MRIFVTGVAGFIGFHLTKKLIENKIPVVGFDNVNDYYDVNLKLERLNVLNKLSEQLGTKYDFIKGDLEDSNLLFSLFKKYQFKKVVNLAAQAGVRYSIENPNAYIKSNIVGFSNILESCRNFEVEHLIYASSSSVYGGNEKLPFSENDNVDHPVSLYAASKRSNELMAHTYSHLYGLPTTGLRFFTVYGPWGRPDMALFLFTKAILEGERIKVFNGGEMTRDFTFIDDVSESLYRLLEKCPFGDKNFDKKNPIPSTSWSPFRIFNVGNANPTNLNIYIESLEKALNKKAIKENMPMQMGDVVATASDSSLLEYWIKYKPSTTIESGIHHFVKWYKSFYNIV